MRNFQKFVASIFIFGFLMSLVVLGSLGFGQISAQLPKAVTVILVLLVFGGAIWLSISLIWTKKKTLEAPPVASSEQTEAVEPAESKDEPLSLAVKILFYLGMFFIIAMPIMWIQENSAERDYAVAVNATRAIDCNVFKKVAKRDRCIIDYLAQTKTRIDVTTEMCANIEDSYNRDSCFDLIGVRTKNAAICAKIDSTDLKELCTSRVQTDNEQNPYIGSIYPNPTKSVSNETSNYISENVISERDLIKVLINNWKTIAPAIIPNYPSPTVAFYGYPWTIEFIGNDKILITYESNHNEWRAVLGYDYDGNFNYIEGQMISSTIPSKESVWINRYGNGSVPSIYTFSSTREGDVVYPTDWVK